MNPNAWVGLFLSLLTALLWSVSMMCWSSASRKIGALNVALLRSLMAGLFLLAGLPLYLWFNSQAALPTREQWLWLVLSSASGMVAGDILSFKGLALMGPRRSGQFGIMAPVAAVFCGWLWLDEALTPRALCGVAVVIGALAYVVHAERRPEADDGKEPGKTSAAGILLSVAGAAFVGLGAVLVRRAFREGPPLDPLVATTIRVACSPLLLWLVALCSGNWLPPVGHLRGKGLRGRMLLGTATGPVIGMFCYVGALKMTETGLVSTLSSLSPLFLVFLVAWRYKARPHVGTVLGIILALEGVALIFSA